jgi:hypothetical protein
MGVAPSIPLTTGKCSIAQTEILMSDDPMARDPRKLSHFERLTALTRELGNPASVRMAEELLALNEQERGDIIALRERAMQRHGVIPPSAPEETPQPAPKDGQQSIVNTVAELVASYRTTDRYRRLGFKVRSYYDRVTAQLLQTCANTNLSDLKGPDIQRLYDFWSDNGKKKSMGHAVIAMLRIVINYGATGLELPECVRISVLLRAMHFRLPRKRSERLTDEHIRLIIARAHRQGRDSLALAQAIQFECPLRQIDVIGQWIPQSEPGVSDVTLGDKKWMRGLRWSAIDQNQILHVTQGSKEIEVNLRDCPLVTAELKRLDKVPASGPVIIDEDTDKPYEDDKYRTLWRTIANSAGVPKNVKNMDSPGGKGLPKARSSPTTATA